MAERGVDVGESVSWDEEWTVLEEDETPNRRDRSPGVDNAEEACRVLSSDGGSPLAASVDARDRDSDGISVVSESGGEEEIADAGRIVTYRPCQSRVPAAEEISLGEQVRTRPNFFFTCCLIFGAIGAAELASRIRFVAESPPPWNPENESPASEDATVARSTTGEFCRGELRRPKDGTLGVVDKEERSIDLDDRIIYPSLEGDGPEYASGDDGGGGDVSNRLQLFLRTACLLLGDIRRVCDTRSRESSDLAKVRILLKAAIEETHEPIKSENEKFLEKMEDRLALIDDAFFNDLTRALDKASSKNEKRLDKIRNKMKERLSLLRGGAEPSENGQNRRQESGTPEADVDTVECREKKPGQTPVVTGRSIGRKTTLGNVPGPDSDYSRRRASGIDGRDRDSRDERCGKILPTSKKHLGDARKRAVYREASRRVSTGDRDENHRSPPLERKKSVNRETTREKEDAKKRKCGSFSSSSGTTTSGAEYSYEVRRDPARSSPRRNQINTRQKRGPGESSASRDTSDVEEEEEEKQRSNIAANGHWQFARSRYRDESRKEEAIENWYFDRARGRKSARTNLNNLEDRR